MSEITINGNNNHVYLGTFENNEMSLPHDELQIESTYISNSTSAHANDAEKTNLTGQWTVDYPILSIPYKAFNAAVTHVASMFAENHGQEGCDGYLEKGTTENYICNGVVKGLAYPIINRAYTKPTNDTTAKLMKDNAIEAGWYGFLKPYADDFSEEVEVGILASAALFLLNGVKESSKLLLSMHPYTLFGLSFGVEYVKGVTIGEDEWYRIDKPFFRVVVRDYICHYPASIVKTWEGVGGKLANQGGYARPVRYACFEGVRQLANLGVGYDFGG